MKRLIIIFFLLIGSLLTFDQVGDFEENADGGGFGSIMVSFRSLDERMAVYSGGGGGFVYGIIDFFLVHISLSVHTVIISEIQFKWKIINKK